jgi:hypothetical protein
MTTYPCICIRDFDTNKVPNSNSKWARRMHYRFAALKGDVLFYTKKAYTQKLRNKERFRLNLRIPDGTLISECEQMVSEYPLHLLYDEKGHHVQTLFDPYLFKHYFRHLSKSEYERELIKKRFDL